MTRVYAIGDGVIYDRELPGDHIADYDCGEAVHYGTVLETTPDASGDQVVTVKFDYGHIQDILASNLHPAADN